MKMTNLNILFFLTPKSKIKCVDETMSIRQVLEIFEHYRYQVIPVLSKDGRYLKSISEGDLLYYLKNNLKFNIKEYETHNILEVPINRDYKEINVLEDIPSLIILLKDQNYVPVIDDKSSFIGIITRKSIIEYLLKNKEKIENKLKQNIEKMINR